MDAFEVHRRLISDYRTFTDGFVDIHDPRVRDRVEEESARGAQWPPPWLSVNPSFEPGGRIDELVREGLLHEECARIFRVKRDQDDPGSAPITLHRHQADAVHAAGSGASYVLTTGTGSGKSLAYIVPIVDRVLREGSGQGVRAIVVYPMNALANSQLEELRKFLEYGYGGAPPVTFDRYTGQENHEERQRILEHPPDILLTNYVMLELVLTRPDERRSLIRAAEGLRFLVLDELHTYRGRQGADVAMLVRRVRDACRARETLQCVGTSATMATGGTVARQRDRRGRGGVADLRCLGEARARDHRDSRACDQGAGRRCRHSGDGDPRSGVCGVRRSGAPHGARGTAQRPSRVMDRRQFRHRNRARKRAAYPACPGDRRYGCEPARRVHRASRTRPAGMPSEPRFLLARGPATTATGQPLFAFRLHQFLSKGGTVYTTLEPEATRPIETDFQVVLPGKPERRLFPLAFCRECGQEYLTARRGDGEGKAALFKARHGLRITDRDDGYLFVSADREWPADPVADGRLPASWLLPDASGQQIVTARRQDVPVRYRAWPDGQAMPYPSADVPLEGATVMAWIPGQVPVLPAVRRVVRAAAQQRVREAGDAGPRRAQQRDDCHRLQRGPRIARSTGG